MEGEMHGDIENTRYWFIDLGVLKARAEFTNDVQYLTNKPHVLLVSRYIELSLVVENPQLKLSVMPH